MDFETETKETTEATETTTETEEQQISNADLKNNPTFLRVTSELASLKKEKADRQAAEEKAAKEAEIKKAESEQRYEDALRMQKEEMEAKENSFKNELLKEKLKAKLFQAGFTNKHFVSGLISDYNAESCGTLDDYVVNAAADEANKMFLGARDVKKPAPPTTGPISLGSNISEAQLRAMSESTDPNLRKQAVDYKADYYDKHGKLPFS